MRRLVGFFAASICVLLAVPAVGLTAVTVGHSGWDWGNPLPQGNQINALEFVGSRGYAAGNFGTVLRTDDAGASWTGIRTGITPDLNLVRTVGAETIIVGGKCTLRRSDNGGQSFARLPWTASDVTCSSDISSFYFPDGSVGYLALVDGNVFRTANGGQSWTRKTAVPTTPATNGQAQPTEVFFTSQDTGFATTSGGEIYRTTDGASSWTRMVGITERLGDIIFIDANGGYAVGAGSNVLRTVDGGTTWVGVNPPFGGLNLTSIRCADALTCLVTDDAGDRLLRTTDGGATWSSVSPSTRPVYAAAFASATRAVAGGQGGATVVSDDAGANWASVGGDLGGRFDRLRAGPAPSVFAAGQNGALARSPDGGQTWTTLGVSTAADVRDVSFPTNEIGFALDSSGSALKTNDSGGSWQVLNTGTSAVPGAILAPNSNVVLLIGPKGVRRSTDGGGQFSPVSGKGAKGSFSDVDQAGSAIFVDGTKALAVSTNSGKSFKKVKRPKGKLDSVDFVSSKIGFALTTDGRVWQTSNRGKRWKQLKAVGNNDGANIVFGSAKSGYLQIPEFANENGGWLLHTSDGGKSWRPQLISQPGVGGVGPIAPSATNAIAIAGDNFLLSTQTGGDAGTTSALTIEPSKKRLKKRGEVKVNGELSPASGSEIASVSWRQSGSTAWQHETVEVAANGTFTVTVKVKKETIFVAQWAGDDDRNGDGSSVATVKVGRR